MHAISICSKLTWVYSTSQASDGKAGRLKPCQVLDGKGLRAQDSAGAAPSEVSSINSEQCIADNAPSSTDTVHRPPPTVHRSPFTAHHIRKQIALHRRAGRGRGDAADEGLRAPVAALDELRDPLEAVLVAPLAFVAG